MNLLLNQENDHLKMIVSKIEFHHPNVLLVEKSVSSFAQEHLLAKEISLVLNIKRPLLERIARCTGATITPSVDHLSTTRLGYCELFHLERVSEDHELLNQFNKKPSKTLMFFEGCPRRFGCTVFFSPFFGTLFIVLSEHASYELMISCFVINFNFSSCQTMTWHSFQISFICYF